MVELVKDTEYEKLIKDNEKVVIDCFATWCGPCKMISPIIDSLSEELKDVKFYKIDVDEAEKITTDYDIMSIPTILIFEKGNLKEKIVGFRSKEELKDIINK